MWFYYIKSFYFFLRCVSFCVFLEVEVRVFWIGVVGFFVLCIKCCVLNCGKGGWVSGSWRVLNVGWVLEVMVGDFGFIWENFWFWFYWFFDIFEWFVDGLDVVIVGWLFLYCCWYVLRVGYVVYNSNVFVVWYWCFFFGVFYLWVWELDCWILFL